MRTESPSWANKSLAKSVDLTWVDPEQPLEAKQEQGLTYYAAPEESRLGQLIKHRIAQERDFKSIITGWSATTGVGKTQLGTVLTDWSDVWGDWTAEDRAFIDLDPWVESYFSGRPGEGLLLDEIEQMMDRRQWWGHTEETHLLAMARKERKLNFWTLPSIGMLERRAIHLADVWIIVERRGVAKPYYLLTIDDPNHAPKTYPMALRDEHGNRERIRWPNLDGDPDIEVLEEMKDSLTDLSRSPMSKTYSEDEVDREIQKSVREERDEWIGKLALKLEKEGVISSMEDIGDLVDLTQTSVWRAKKKLKQEAE